MNTDVAKKFVLYGALALGAIVLLIALFHENEKEMSNMPPPGILELIQEPTEEMSGSQASTTETFRIEVVNTPAAREQGLSGRTNVPKNYGMLFIFPMSGEYGFWMKDMEVPIDIIWLSDTGSILAIEALVAPETYPNVFYPPEPVRYVLETRAGEAARKGWATGETLLEILPSLESVSE